MNSKNKRKAATEQVSELTTGRLSVYLRCLNQLEADGVETISSQTLAERFHLNAAQIRKDLAYFGEFGVRGVGYYVKDLKLHLRQILGLDKKLKVAVMGAGNLGMALADYPGFRREGFEIVAMFDSADGKIGEESRGGVPIHDIRDIRKVLKKERVDIVVLAVPAETRWRAAASRPCSTSRPARCSCPKASSSRAWTSRCRSRASRSSWRRATRRPSRRPEEGACRNPRD